MTRAGRVVAFIERYCLIPEGAHVGKPLRLLPFQKRFIEEVYDNPNTTSRAYLSIARKNGKTSLIAAIVLAHLVGPEARLNSQIISGARSRDQAALVFKLAQKMVALSPELSKLVRVIPSGKTLIGLRMNVEYKAISAEAGTAHGLSPVVAILDEVGQVRGSQDAFVEAIETAQGAHEDPLLIAISTQAATDDDLFSRWLDDAASSKDPKIISHVYSAPADCDLMDEAAWAAANPALGVFRMVDDLRQFAEQAVRMPAKENSFRWLFLNQRIEAQSPYVSPAVWNACAGENEGEPEEWFGGLDLSAANDLTAYVKVGWVGGILNVKSKFWLPENGLFERSRADRVPYDVWARKGLIDLTPGQTIDYDYVAPIILKDIREGNVKKIAFDRWNWRFFRAALERAGATEEEIGQEEKDGGVFSPFGQGYQSMSPALRSLDERLLTARLRHGGHPVLTMCAANSIVKTDPAGNRKLIKAAENRRIDGMIALAMAVAMAGEPHASEDSSYLDDAELLVL